MKTFSIKYIIIIHVIMSRITPVSETDQDNNMTVEQSWSILKYSHNRPLLNWHKTNHKGIYKSGWMLLKPTNTNICFCNNMESNNTMHFIIEYPFKSNNIISFNNLVAIGFFFEREVVSGTINLIVRIKHFYGEEKIIIYRDCKYFGIDKETVVCFDKTVDSSIFVVSNDWQDKSLLTGVNFIHKYTDFHYVVEYINDVIQRKLVEASRVNEVSQAMPLLVCKNTHQVIPNDTSAHNLIEYVAEINSPPLPPHYEEESSTSSYHSLPQANSIHK